MVSKKMTLPARSPGRALRRALDVLRRRAGRDLRILDLGGHPDYWQRVGVGGVERIVLFNMSAAAAEARAPFDIIESRIGDLRDLGKYRDKSFDLVHSNSVIEHLGRWDDMCRMAAESVRIGIAGWIRTPAFEFPFEPHFRLPFIHWFAPPLRRAALRLSRSYGALAIRERRRHVDGVNLLSGDEIRALFPNARIAVERFLLLPRSYVARW